MQYMFCCKFLWHVTAKNYENWFTIKRSYCKNKKGIVFNVRQKTDARYSYRLDVFLSVRPSHAGIVSKRLNLSSDCLHCLVAP